MNAIDVRVTDETFANCSICHERDVTRLVDIELPVVVLTLCRPCASLLAQTTQHALSTLPIPAPKDDTKTTRGD